MERNPPETDDHGRMPSLRLLTTGQATDDFLRELRSLLGAAFGAALSDHDWAHTLGGWHVAVVEDGRPISHAAVVPRALEAAGRTFRTGYVEGMATTPGRQREGLGSSVMAEVAGLVRAHFELGALSTGHHDFYERLGWERWRGPTFARRDGDLIRTEEDDDSLMVLRVGPSLGLDLAGPISCEARTGDHW